MAFRTLTLSGLIGALTTLTAFTSNAAAQSEPLDVVSISSPDMRIEVTIDTGLFDRPQYHVTFDGEDIVFPSRLGLRFQDHASLDQNFQIISADYTSQDATWEQPWGEQRFIRDNHNAVTVTFESTDGPLRSFDVTFKVFDDGIGFRYEVPEQPGTTEINIVDELTEFAIEPAADAWWIPSRMYNRYEYLYHHTTAGEMTIAHTPATFRTTDGIHLSIHEAALVDYAGMSLLPGREGVLKADLAPWYDGILVRKEGGFTTPWRTIQIGDEAVDLLNSHLILNLNEPNKLGDVSWVEPGKYIGIWWAMHIKDRSWGTDAIHGATTEEAKQYIDFAAEHGFDGVLIEGWNIGWDGDWFNNGDVFSFTESYPDFDIQAVTDYALERGVRLIGHHETSGNVTNYERQIEDAFDLYEATGVRQVKTGYVADGGNIKRIDENGIARYEWHDGQYMSNHHIYVVERAAEHKISINAHEPIKDTGLRRTYPNWISREGARGMEFNAWGVPPNGPEHLPELLYTRMLAGPMDFTPGIFELRPNELPPVRDDLPRNDVAARIETTLAKQLATYVVLYSPIQMAADLPEHYEARPDAFQFIKDVAVDWETSIALQGEVGEFAIVARQERGADVWFLGGLTDAVTRDVSIPLDFLEPEVSYVADVYRDGANADYETNPYDIVIEQLNVTSDAILDMTMARSGGFAIRFRPEN